MFPFATTRSRTHSFDMNLRDFAVFHQASRPRAKEVETFGLEIFIEASSCLTPNCASSALQAGAHG